MYHDTQFQSSVSVTDAEGNYVPRANMTSQPFGTGNVRIHLQVYALHKTRFGLFTSVHTVRMARDAWTLYGVTRQTENKIK
jgi:hypothetical protein